MLEKTPQGLLSLINNRLIAKLAACLAGHCKSSFFNKPETILFLLTSFFACKNLYLRYLFM